MYKSTRALMTAGSPAAMAAARAGANAGTGILDRPNRLVRGCRAILDVEADHAGLQDFGDALAHLIRRLTVAGLDVGGDRHANRPHNAFRCRHHFLPGRAFAVGEAQAPGHAAAGGRHRAKTGGLELTRAHGVPGVRQQQQRRRPMRLPKGLSQLLLPVPCHDKSLGRERGSQQDATP
jgi:hypothetical protein